MDGNRVTPISRCCRPTVMDVFGCPFNGPWCFVAPHHVSALGCIPNLFVSAPLSLLCELSGFPSVAMLHPPMLPCLFYILPGNRPSMHALEFTSHDSASAVHSRHSLLHAAPCLLPRQTSPWRSPRATTFSRAPWPCGMCCLLCSMCSLLCHSAACDMTTVILAAEG
jgi:hypothetical protein